MTRSTRQLPIWLQANLQLLWVGTATGLVAAFGPPALPFALGGSMLGLSLLEHLFPRRPEWRHEAKGAAVDFGFYWAGRVFIWGPFLEDLEEGFLAPHLQRFGEVTTIAARVESLPFVARVVLCILGSELISYWTHRISHASEVFWRISGHAVHHSSTKLTASKTIVNHPAEILVMALPMLLMAEAFGLRAPEICVAIAFITSTAHTVHANVQMKDGPWNTVLVSPTQHAFHHSVYVDEQNSNYACALIALDKVFRSFRKPTGVISAGLAPGVELSFGRQLIIPYVAAPRPPVRRDEVASPAVDAG